MQSRSGDAVRRPRAPKSWELFVRLPPPGVAPEVVGIFVAQQEPGWQLTGELARQDGRLIVRSFTVQPVLTARKAAQQALGAISASRIAKPGSTVVTEYFDDVANAKTPRGGVTAQLLRSIPFGALLAELLVRMAATETTPGDLPDDGPVPEEWEFGRRRRHQAEVIRDLEHKVGRRPYTDDFYRGVAEECLSIQSERLDVPVTPTLAERRVTKYETARGWIKEARRRGMLAPGSPGRSGFEAGSKLHQVQRSGDGT